MTIRALALGAAVTLAASLGIATFHSASAASCCGYVNGKYVNLKTGKPAKPPKHSAQRAAPGGSGGATAPHPTGDNY